MGHSSHTVTCKNDRMISSPSVRKKAFRTPDYVTLKRWPHNERTACNGNTLRYSWLRFASIHLVVSSQTSQFNCLAICCSLGGM